MFLSSSFTIAEQRIFNCNSEMFPISCYQLIYKHFGENHVTLRPTAAKSYCIKLRAVFFSRTPWVLQSVRALGKKSIGSVWRS